MRRQREEEEEERMGGLELREQGEFVCLCVSKCAREKF